MIKPSYIYTPLLHAARLKVPSPSMMETNIVTRSRSSIKTTDTYHVFSKESLSRLLWLCNSHRNLSKGMRELRISLPDTKRVPVPLLHDIFRRVCGLEMLEVILPLLSERQTGTILRNVRLPRLSLLVAEVPHRSLVSFLARHSCITTFTTGSCSSSGAVCPLSTVTSAGTIVELSGPMSCVPYLIDGNPIARLRVSWKGYRYFELLLHHVGTGTSHITHLDLEFVAQDTQFLIHLARLVPFVYRLRLREVSSQEVLSYPWEHSHHWTAGLSMLRQLRYLCVETQHLLVRKGTSRKELQVFRPWLQSCRGIEFFEVSYRCESGTRRSVWQKTWDEGRPWKRLSQHVVPFNIS